MVLSVLNNVGAAEIVAKKKRLPRNNSTNRCRPGEKAGMLISGT